MLESESPGAPTAAPRTRWISRAVDFIIVPALILLALWLPPASLGERLFAPDMPRFTPEAGGEVRGPAGASLAVPQGALAKDTRIDLTTPMDGEAPLAADRLVAAVATGDTLGYRDSSVEVRAAKSAPGDAVFHGPLYRLALRGPQPSTATLTLPLPEGLASTEATDVLAFAEDAWRQVASQPSADGRTLVARLDGIPEAVAIAQRVPSRAPVAVGGPEAADVLGASALYMGDASIADDYVVGGVVPSAAHAGGRTAFLRVSDISNGILRTDLVGNMLAIADYRETHVAAIVAAATDAGYSGVELHYAGVDAAQRADFTAFVRDLAGALHADGLLLALHMADPQTIGNAAAYDWVALGQAADVVRLSAPSDPPAYAPGGDMDRLLTWATRQVDRRKVELVIHAESRDVSPTGIVIMPYQQALGVLAREVQLDDDMYLPGASLTARLPDLARSPIQFDAQSGTYWFAYRDDAGNQHVVWLENGTSVGRKLQYVSQYALGGVAIEGWTP
ncbi:MAG: hypothetical protein GX649_17135, partial [Chloroflexi bacterium]|nr:hypothetical protein [Chloroflexota bacterium]